MSPLLSTIRMLLILLLLLNHLRNRLAPQPLPLAFSKNVLNMFTAKTPPLLTSNPKMTIVPATQLMVVYIALNLKPKALITQRLMGTTSSIMPAMVVSLLEMICIKKQSENIGANKDIHHSIRHMVIRSSNNSTTRQMCTMLMEGCKTYKGKIQGSSACFF